MKGITFSILAVVILAIVIKRNAETLLCPDPSSKSREILTGYLDALFSHDYDSSLSYWTPNGTWWTLGTKAVVPFAGFSTIEEHTAIMKQQLTKFTTTDWHAWNWVVSDRDRSAFAEFWLDWQGPEGLRYEANASVAVKFDDDFKIVSLHEYLDLTRRPTRMTQ